MVTKFFLSQNYRRAKSIHVFSFSSKYESNVSSEHFLESTGLWDLMRVNM